MVTQLAPEKTEVRYPGDHGRYSLTEVNSRRAVERGLAEADWYKTPVPRQELKKLMERRNGPAIRDTLVWFGLLFGTGAWAYSWWGSWWAILPFAIYGVLYASVSDSRWHEAGHGTAFKTDWMNKLLYEIASFMVMRESTLWHWSHTRHHTDTIIVGRDREIHVPRPPDLKAAILNFLNYGAARQYFQDILRHSFGKISEEEQLYIPESEFRPLIWKARIHLAIYAGVSAWALSLQSLLPLLYVGLPNIYGSWLMVIYGYTQHAGLAENVLDHRLNCRTVYMNRINRFLYWNMNYHLEHHMFPLVPYHRLPELHQLIKHDCPEPYQGLPDAYREIIPTILRQVKDPGYYIRRKLPSNDARRAEIPTAQIHAPLAGAAPDGWLQVAEEGILEKEDVIRLDYDGKTYAIYRTREDRYYATDGICTHGSAHLADGYVKEDMIECPKHNGRFNLKDGSPAKIPVCVGIRTYPVKLEGGILLINIKSPGGAGSKVKHKTHRFKVISNRNVATYIKELILEPEIALEFRPGDYLQFNIPAYEHIDFREIEVEEPYAAIWEKLHIYDYQAGNPAPVRRNYSLAGNPEKERYLRFNIRLATPPTGQDCNAGVGSTYMHHLKPGDRVTAIGPFGDFHLKETDKELIYVGGGSGMAPLRSHISYLLETLQTDQKVSYWYGARARREIFYQDYFEDLESRFENFRFHLALSEPQPEDQWNSHTGYIHEVLKKNYLDSHPDPRAVEYYLCGPPAMVAATTRMLNEAFGVEQKNISFDEF